MKKQLIQHIATKLREFGYDVYLSANGEHGFYTNGRRVVSFGGHWNVFVDFSGNYAPTRESGTGWLIADKQADIKAYQADMYINANAPDWTRNKNPIYTTPDQHLKTYGKSSGYKRYTMPIKPENFTRAPLTSVNGNPRYIIHFLHLSKDDDAQPGDITGKYAAAVERASKLGGKKYHNNQYGGGIIFQSYNVEGLCDDLNNAMRDH
jgi:hypothetical protein